MITLLVTRPQPQADAWCERLREARVDAQPVPLLHIGEAPDGAAVDQAWKQLPTWDGLMFVSPAAVACWMRARPDEVRWPDRLWAAAPGPGTAKALRDAGVTHVLEPAADAAQFDSDSLWDAIEARAWRGQRVLIVHGGAGRERLAERWRAAGAHVHQVQAYQRHIVLPEDGPTRQRFDDALRNPAGHAWLFSSGDVVDALVKLLPSQSWASHRAVCTHPAIGERAQRAGFGRVDQVRPDPAAIAVLTMTQP